ncbi:MAG TPA: hypothetical protein VFV19_13875 [Candidatus Polarisedimenticolaceae bacterium]|nr:hypothetical protein [Candidatus Polarisedimenticolaceae bacterium]
MPRRSSLKRSLTAIERAFADLERQLARLTKRARQAARSAARSAKPGARNRRTLRLTPKRRAQLKLQGAYMGYMRPLKPAQKARVKAVKEKRGFEAAIRVAKRLATR